MNRKSKGPAFLMRSGNTSTFKMMGSSSPIRNPEDKFKTMNTTYDNVTGDMTDEQLRNMTLEQHKVDGKPKANKFNVDMKTMIKLRNQLKNQSRDTDVKSTTETKKVVDQSSTKTSETKEKDRDYDVYAISSEDQKRITEKYGMGPDPTGNREKELKRAAEKFANRNLGY